MDINEIVKQAMADSNFMETLKTKLEEAETAAKTWPQAGNAYYYVNTDYNVGANIFADNSVHQRRKQVGNCYDTSEEAEHAAECAFYRSWYRNLGRSFVPGARNWFVNYDFDTERMEFCCWTTSAVENVCFGTREEAEAAIMKIGLDNYIRYVLDAQQR